MSEYRDKADTDRCYFCPKQTGIEVHHIVPQRFNGSDNRINLVAICDRCHEKLERLYGERFYQKLGIGDKTGKRECHFECLTCDSRAKMRVSVHGSKSSWFCVECAADLAERKRDNIHGYMLDPSEMVDVHKTVLDSKEEAKTAIKQELEQ